MYSYVYALLILPISFSLSLIAEHVKDFSCGPLHYKTFYMDERNNALYVGAM